MLVSNKHFTPVIGLDIHIVILFGFPIPLPHPYIGFVLDVADYIPFLGATTKINHVPRGKSDTSGIFIILFHIPMGGPFLLAPLIGHDSVNFFGSKRVHVEGNYMSPAGHMLMTCSDIGLPLGFNFKPGKKKPLPSMYLPTSFAIPLSFGKPVMVGGPFVPDWAGALLNMVMSLGFGAALKGLGKLAKKGATKFNKALQKKVGSNKLSKYLCKKGFEPIDMVQGIVLHDAVDFELPGPILLKWERSWSSDSPHEGPLGHGTHLSYDLRVLEFAEEEATLVLLGDGRSAVFSPLPYNGNSDYNRHEKLTLTRTDLEEFSLFNHEENLYYSFRKLHPLDTAYRLYSIRNEAGFMISLHYGSRGQLLRIIDSAGRRLQMEHDQNNRITSVTAHHNGQQRLMIRYAYNGEGDLTEVTDALKQSTRITYRDHLMLSKTDRNGQTFYWEYDKQGRCIHTWGEDGLLEGLFEYHPKKGYNLVTNSLGQTSTFYYTPDFVVTQIKDPLGFSTFTEYTDDFEIYRQIDQEGNVTGYTYDERGNRTGVEHPDGSVSTYTYDGKGRLVLTGDPDGNSRAYVYYKNGQHQGLLHTTTETDGSIIMFNYNDNNLLCEISDEQRRETMLEYDADHNLTSLARPNGTRSHWEYDAWGNCIRSEDPFRKQQYFGYDLLGRVTDIRLPQGNHLRLAYNAYKDVTEVTDKQHQVKFTYTPLGALKTREESGAKVNFLYNTEGLLTGVVNEYGDSYRLTRNQRGDIIQETGFDGLSKHYERDAAGKVIKVHRPGKRWTEFEYDASGRLTRCEYSDGSWETYSYNRVGRLVEALNEHATIKFSRDNIGRIVQEWQNGYTVTSKYNEDGQRTTLQSSLGADIQLHRNALGDVTEIAAQAAGLDNPWQVHIERNLLGLEIERSLPGGIKSSWRYDQTNMPECHNVTNGQRHTREWHYRWDANQQLKELINSVGTGTARFSYDDFGNLAWVQYEDGQYDYRLPDKTGNLYKTQNRQDRQYGQGGQLLESDKARYQYDEEGNLTKKIAEGGAIWEYDWYGNGLLKKVTRPDGKTVGFRYDPLARRIEKTCKGQITRFVWDGHVPLHEWKYPENERPQSAINELGDLQQDHPEPVPPQTLTTWVFEERKFAPSARIVNGKQYSIIHDHLGTPAEAYDEAGQKVWSCELDIYGGIRKLEGDRELVPFRYPGQYEDAETDLCYNRYRYYNPAEGNYISKDPAGLAGGIRLYSYVADPNTLLDIFGLNPTYYPVDELGRPTGATAEVTKSGIGTGSDASVDPPGWQGGEHPNHQQRGHLIANNHGGSGTDPRNIVAITDGTNHPGMTKFENKITKHVKNGNTVLVEVKPHYNGDELIPHKITMYAIDQDGKVIVDETVHNGLRQATKCCVS